MTTALLGKPRYKIEPVYIGPTWRRNPDWDGKDKLTEFVLPELTLGWQILRWIAENLLGDESNGHSGFLPFAPTAEQARFILWWYAIDEQGRFVYRNGVLQRLKGWGKDPLLAVICAVEFLAPCRFAGWAKVDMPDLGVQRGEPVATEQPRAWIQVAATAKSQTSTTMTIFEGLFTEECKKANRLDFATFQVVSRGTNRRIQAITSSPKTIEGGRPTFICRNESHLWVAANKGLLMAEVIDRNAAKAKGGAARALSITNAYEPSENSFAQLQREAWEMENEGLSISTGMLYDSIEAPTSVGFAPPKAHPSDPDATEAEIREYIAAVIDAVRGDATWLDLDTITGRILSGESRPSQSRRFYFNQITGVEDAAFDPGAIDAATHPELRVTRVHAPDPLRVGWSIVRKADPIVVFGDGSKSEDSTGLIGRRLSDGYTFTIGVWSQPSEVDRRKGWLVPREEVTERVHEMFDRFAVTAFWFDPSHALDDDGERYWDGVIDGWHRQFKDRIDQHFWATRTGDIQHSMMWDMTSPVRQKLFTPGVELAIREIQTVVEDQWAPPWFHDGNKALKAHLKNARRSPNPWGVSLRKEGRNSLRKIDLATCVAGARMLDRIVQNRGIEEDAPAGGWGWSV